MGVGVHRHCLNGGLVWFQLCSITAHRRTQSHPDEAVSMAWLLDALAGKPTPGDAGAGTSESGRAPALPDDADKMTIDEIKNYLTEHDFSDDVWKLSNKKCKKADWLKLLKDKCA